MRLRLIQPVVLSLVLGGPAAVAQVPTPAAELNQLRDTVGTILDAGVRDSAFPGAIAVIGTRRRVLLERRRATWIGSPPRRPMTAPCGTWRR